MKWLWGIAIISLYISSCSTIVHGPADEEKSVQEHGDKPKTTEIALGDEPASEKIKNDNNLDLEKREALPKKRIYLLKVLNRSPYGGDTLSEYVKEEMERLVKKIPEFDLVKDVDKSEDFLVGGEFFFRNIFEKARNQNIQGVLAVQVDDVEFKERGDDLGLFRSRIETAEAKVRVQMFDAVTEREVYSRTGADDVTEEFTQILASHSDDAVQTSRAKRAIQKAINKASLDLDKQYKKIGWEGVVVKVDFHRVYVNAGEASGLVKGQLLNVYSPSPNILDPKTGDSLGYGKGTFKGIVKVIDFTGVDLALASVVSGGGFKEMDRIELSRLKR